MYPRTLSRERFQRNCFNCRSSLLLLLHVIVSEVLTQGRCAMPQLLRFLALVRQGTPEGAFSKAYTASGFSGKIPSCLCTGLPSLTTLHLAGNGLIGEVPKSFSSNLTDIVVSYNRLTGRVPTEDYLRFNRLDVSHNLIRGTLSDAAFIVTDKSSTTTCYCNNNRVSGNSWQSFELVAFDRKHHVLFELPTYMCV
jgi:hypothetical protein